MAKKAVALDPKNHNSRFQLAYIHSSLWLSEEAAKHYEEFLHIEPTDLVTHFNLCNDYVRLKAVTKLHHAAERALPFFMRHLKKNPDDQNQKISYAFLLEYLGRKEESLRITVARILYTAQFVKHLFL